MNLHRKQGFIFTLAILCSFLSCRKDKPEQPEPNIPGGVASKGSVFVVNEGNFQWGNASLGFYNQSDSTYSGDIFKAVNNRPLGDVFQSMEIIDGKAYLVINNSGKIEIINMDDFKNTATITGLVSPRYILAVSNTKAYVSDFAANAIAVVDLKTNSVTGHIACKGWTEEMLVSDGKVFVTNLQSEYIYVINTNTDAITDSIKTGYASNSIRKDKNGKLWVLCSGESFINKPGSLHRINPVTHETELSLFYQDANQNPFKLKMNGKGDTLYFLNNGVCVVPVNAPVLADQPFIDQKNNIFWGLGIEPDSGDIYVSDAIDYVQRGKIYIYTSEGKPVNSFLAGIIPGSFYFYKGK